MAKDFFDDDLVTSEPPEEINELSEVETPSAAITQAGMGRMGRQKKQINSQVAGTARELEELRLKQRDLEKAKSDLEELNRKQGEYERSKRDMTEKLSRGIRLLEKEEVQATRMAELLAVMRSRFKDTLGELRAIDETAWSDGDYEVELNKALVLLDEAKAIYKKALAKIDAEGWVKEVTEPLPSRKMQGEIGRELASRPGFLYWLMVGLAVSIPFALIALIWGIVYLQLNGLLV